MANIEEICERYEDRIRKILDAIRLELHEQTTLKCGDVCEMEQQWSMLVVSPQDMIDNKFDLEQGVDISIEVIDSEEHDGEEDGVNFGINLSAIGGGIVGGLTPYNYTERCWADRSDAEAVEERFCIIEQADLGELTHLVVDWYRQEREENVANVDEVQDVVVGND